MLPRGPDLSFQEVVQSALSGDEPTPVEATLREASATRCDLAAIGIRLNNAFGRRFGMAPRLCRDMHRATRRG